MLRSAADLARDLGVSRSRLHPYVVRANAEPVARRGAARPYDQDGQREILSCFWAGQDADPVPYGIRDPELRARVAVLAHDLDVIPEWREAGLPVPELPEDEW